MSYPIILASGSPARQQLLTQLRLPFSVQIAEIDETPRNGENGFALVERLAREKNSTVKENFPDSVIISADTITVVDGQILGKPGSHDVAVEQLQRQSGKWVEVITGLCVYNPAQQLQITHADSYKLQLRMLTRQQIENYLQIEKPYHCCGSLKMEGMGMAIINKYQGADPTVVIGLPIIHLLDELEKIGIKIL